MKNGEIEMKINRYKIKFDTTINEILNNGFEYSVNYKCLTKFITLKNSIVLYIRIPLSEIYAFDDINNVDVLDDDFCQPYTPFYNNYDKDINVENKFLIDVVKRYNEEMNKITFLELNNK